MKKGPALHKRVTVGHLTYDAMTLTEARDAVIAQRRSEGGPLLVVTPNLAISAATRGKAATYEREDVLVLPDGKPLLWIARLSGHALPQRVAGSDLVCELLRTRFSPKDINSPRVAIIGGSPGAAECLADQFMAAGWSQARGWEASAQDLARQEFRVALYRDLMALRPDVTLIGIGHPRQEALARDLANRDVGGALLCIGMAINYAAGRARRAPAAFQRVGAEWLWRLAAEPRRLAHRYLVVSSSELLRLSIWALRTRMTGAVLT